MSRTASTGTASTSPTTSIRQSAHIAQGVDAAGNKDEGAGDQGIMFGFACDETPDLMPATLDYSHKILDEMAADRHSAPRPFLEPDAKSQVTLRFEDGKPVAGDRDRRLDPAQAGLRQGREGGRAPRLCEERRRRASSRRSCSATRPSITSTRPAASRSAGRTATPGSPAARSSSTLTAARPRTAAALSRARTRPRSTARPPMPRAISPRTSSPPVSPAAARSSSPMRSASPSRCRSTSTRTAPARSTTTRSSRRSAGSTSSAA